MRSFVILILSGLVLTSCSQDSFARYRLKASSLIMVPELGNGEAYRSTTDTVELKELIAADYYIETQLPSPIPSENVDKVEVQVMSSIISSEPIQNLIEYRFLSVPDGSQRTGSYDRIVAILLGANDTILAEIELENKDSILCAHPDCRFADTLTIDSVNYFNVYYLAEDPQKANLYINETEGVVAYRDESLNTYQRIK